MLLNILQAFSDKDWNWYEISGNPCITIDYIIAFPNVEWDWFRILCNLDINLNELIKIWKKQIKNNSTIFSKNINSLVISNIMNSYDKSKLIELKYSRGIFDLISIFPDKEWNWTEISWIIDVPLDIIKNNILKDWNWYGLSWNSSTITLEFIDSLYTITNHDLVEHIHKLIDWRGLSYILDFTKEQVLFTNGELTRKWDFDCLSSNESITFNFIISHDFEWNWLEISGRINMEIIDASLHLDFNYPWERCGLSENPNITIEFIETYFSDSRLIGHWNWEKLSNNPIIDIEFVKRHIDKDWDWIALSSNSGITLEMIESNLEFSWDWDRIGYNPNLTLEFIYKYKDKFQRKYNSQIFHAISYNEFHKDLYLVRQESKLINKKNCWNFVLSKIYSF